MLVLKRSEGESLLIGGNIEVKVTRCEGKACRLGVTAPPHIPILRPELLPRVQPRPPQREDFAADGALVRYGADPVLLVASPGAGCPLRWPKTTYARHGREACEIAERLADILQAGLHEHADPDASDLGEAGLRALAAAQANTIGQQASELASLRAQQRAAAAMEQALATILVLVRRGVDDRDLAMIEEACREALSRAWGVSADQVLARYEDVVRQESSNGNTSA